MGLHRAKEFKGSGDRGRLAMQGSMSVLRLRGELQPARELAESVAEEMEG